MCKLAELLNDNMENYILPFFWQHGEDEATLREYMGVIDQSNIKAVCVESRPHPDYCGDKWWQDLEVIFDEAKKRDMKVWILDDSHFPSGYANGALVSMEPSLRRQFLTYRKVAELSDETFAALPEYAELPVFVKSQVEKFVMKDSDPIPGDACLGFTAVSADGTQVKSLQDGETLSGSWTVYGLYKTCNRGPHRDYINMCDKDSVKVFIDTVYEAHFDRFSQYFGNVLEGFFSDEPELGNGHLYEKGKRISEMEDQPYSKEVEAELQELWGDAFLENLTLVFNDIADTERTSLVRVQFMDVITRAVERDFSYQIGDWCRAHNVKYIGHMIEDNNEHSRTGSSLGHFFRGLKGQNFAGIDDIGGQVLPYMEDAVIRSKFTGSIRDGVYYHFTMGKLASSAAAIDPLKKGNSMCEIFGNYGWEEGVYLEKYLVDHFMVNGVNHFVPHAFSPAPFPDPDCPPHFYAHGHNPQYRAFGQLMKYTNRVCNLISDGRMVRKVAVIYHGEADWTGLDYMNEDVVARALTEAHIDFDIVPADVFTDSDYTYEIKDGKLKVSLGSYDALVIPQYPYIRDAAAAALNEFVAQGGRVYAINEIPACLAAGDLAADAPAVDALKADCVSLEGMLEAVADLAEISLSGDSKNVKYLHYEGDAPVYYLVNEDRETYRGTLTLPRLNNPVIYDAWENRVYNGSFEKNGDVMTLPVELESRKSLIITEAEDLSCRVAAEELLTDMSNEISLTSFKRSVCEGIAYPDFKEEKEVTLPDRVEEEYPKFGGFIRYTCDLEIPAEKAVLKLDGLLEGVEVILNGKSLGWQVVPTYIYDLSPALQSGMNHLEIISATTLERFVEKKSHIPGVKVPEPTNILGMQGTAKICF